MLIQFLQQTQRGNTETARHSRRPTPTRATAKNKMDKVSPALQYGLDPMENCSWESSSPHACQSSSDSTLTAPADLGSSQTNPRDSVTYSVMNLEGNPQSRSQESTPSPSNLQIVQESGGALCKEELQASSEYDCGLTASDNASMGAGSSPQEVRSKTAHRGYRTTHASGSGYEEEEYQHIVDMTVPPTPEVSTAAGDHLASIPAPSQCIQFGTILPAGNKDPRIRIVLEGAELWDQFFRAGTEMIITKSGRYVWARR